MRSGEKGQRYVFCAGNYADLRYICISTLLKFVHKLGKVVLEKKMFLENKKLRIEFGEDGGGFPTKIELKYPSDSMTVVDSAKPFLRIGLADGRVAEPFLEPGFQPFYSAIDDCQRIQFDRLPFKDQSGKMIESFFLTLRYEIYNDGTVFVQSHFISETFLNPPDLNAFKISFPLKLDHFRDFSTPFGMAPDLSGHVSEDHRNTVQPGIQPVFNLNCKSADGRGGYFELFMEDASALDQGMENRETEILWSEHGPTVTWNFQTEPAVQYHRNVWEALHQWGWLFSAPPVFRRNPPYRLYHWIDAFDYRIPTPRQVELMASSGADVIILHEVWRSDVAGIAFPYDQERLKVFIEAAHRNSMHVVLYIRGVVERTTVEDSCDWFSEYLTKDWDGVYADFGGVLNGPKPYRFKQHYLNSRRIRREIGKYGLFYAHLGCLSSAIGLTPEIIDGYVSGEGEMGTLGQERFLHESLSGAYVTTGTFWTAAFPEYGQGSLVPFMAASGQYPHSPLGEQHRSSSLAHPCVPGINDLYLRPLWKLWKPFRDARDLSIYNDFNGSNVIRKNNVLCGTYLMLDRTQNAALLIVANFSSEIQKFSCEIDWTALSFTPSSDVGLLQPHSNAPGKAARVTGDTYGVTLPAYECAAFLFGKADALEEYEKPYPKPSEECLEFRGRMERQMALRTPENVPSGEVFCKVRMPTAQTPCICIVPFYATEHEIGTLDEHGNFHFIGYVTKSGISQEKPTTEQWLWAQDESPWFRLNDMAPEGGRISFAVRSYSLELKCYFHSFAEIILANTPDDSAAQTLVFMNGVEADRSRIHFNVQLSAANRCQPNQQTNTLL